MVYGDGIYGDSIVYGEQLEGGGGMAVAPVYVDAPSVQSPLFTLLDSVDLITGADPHSGLGVQYESEFCGPARVTNPACAPVLPKTADDGVELVMGEPIPVYHIHQCRAVGDWDRSEQRALRALDLGASRAVMEGFQDAILADPDLADLTAGIAVSLVDGLAMLEQYAAENYGGVPVIFMSRADALRLIALQAVYRVGDHLETGLGSLVVADGGYDPSQGPTAPAAGEGYLLATGQVTVRVGATTTSGPQLAHPELVSEYNNEFVALAERTYVPTYECFAAAALVTESV